MEVITARYIMMLVSFIILQLFVHQVYSFNEDVKNKNPSIVLSPESEDKLSDTLTSAPIHPAAEYEEEDSSIPQTKSLNEKLDIGISDNYKIDESISEKDIGNGNIKGEEINENNDPGTGNQENYLNTNNRDGDKEEALNREKSKEATLELLKAFDFTRYKIITSPEKEEDEKKASTDISGGEDNSNYLNQKTVEKVDDGGEGAEEDEDSVSSKKPRYLPLLYSVGSFFSSFLAEFGETPSSSPASSHNLSESEMQNSTTDEKLLLMYENSTNNATDQKKKTRFQCSLSSNNLSEINETSEVKIINSTELMEMLNFSKNQKSTSSPCVVVMFYTKWCPFSARAAPEYNALARAFPLLDVLAVDTSHFSYLNAKFGTVAVPNIMLFHSRSAVRFNHTTRNLDHFIQFIVNNTGLEPTLSVAVLPEDYQGPLSSTVEEGRDWLLWLSWIFILVFSIYVFFFSLYGQSIIARITVLWQEHQHIE